MDEPYTKEEARQRSPSIRNRDEDNYTLAQLSGGVEPKTLLCPSYREIQGMAFKLFPSYREVQGMAFKRAV